jgi:hypothetical protein
MQGSSKRLGTSSSKDQYTFKSRYTDHWGVRIMIAKCYQAKTSLLGKGYDTSIFYSWLEFCKIE